jgi:MoaA/NifB/PqqE/SkfB family radical SAM enzyme
VKRVIDEVASMRTDEQMGIIWGGGDPTANPFTYDAMLYARDRGISASFLTNGVFLEVDRTLDADPILIRVSLNCGTEDAYRRFHGYPRGWDYFDRVRRKMRELARRKLERNARTLVGISLIVDERNMDDLEAAAIEIRSVVEDAGPGIDYVIVRPVMNYSHFASKRAKLTDDTRLRAEELIEGGPVGRIIGDLGIPLVPIKDSFAEPPPPEFYDDGSCLAYGMASEIRHNGDVQLCSDSYGNPDYTIGNLVRVVAVRHLALRPAAGRARAHRRAPLLRYGVSAQLARPPLQPPLPPGRAVPQRR